MNLNDLKLALRHLEYSERDLQDYYEENGGEYTPEAEEKEEMIEAVKAALEGEGVDMLGRWLKRMDDEKLAYKLEKGKIDRRIKAIDQTIDFIKATATEVLIATQRDKVRGKAYGFYRYESRKTTFDADALNAQYLDKVQAAAREAGLPDSVDVVLKTSSTRLLENEVTAALVTTATAPSVKFTRPVGVALRHEMEANED